MMLREVEPDASEVVFGELLRQRRLAAGLSQGDLASLAGLSVRGISDLERGARTAPHPNTVRRLAEALGLTETASAELIQAARRPRPSREGDASITTQSAPVTVADTDPAVLSVGASIPTAVAVMDAEGRLIALNGAAEDLLGVSSQQALGRPYPAVFGSSLADRLVGLFVHVGRSGNPSQTHLLEATLPAGRRATLRASVGPLRGAGGQVLGILFVAEDRTIRAHAVADPHEEELKSRRLYEALERYVGNTVAAAVEARPSFVSVGGERKIVSVLHADVRGYTAVAETLPPDEVMQLLLRYHGAAVSALRATGATLDRFIGDAILALWNAPNPEPDHARQALRGALALQAAVRSVGTELGYGVGVHSGEVVVGNLGTPEFMNYTAVGDTVNLAARLQAAAAAGEVVCSAVALEQASNAIPAMHLGLLTVKGRTQPVDAYKLQLS